MKQAILYFFEMRYTLPLGGALVYISIKYKICFTDFFIGQYLWKDSWSIVIWTVFSDPQIFQQIFPEF